MKPSGSAISSNCAKSPQAWRTKGLRRTYFSTPSSEEHEAYPFWTGDQFNKHRRSDRVDIDTSYKALKNGKLGG
jgi:hypothetical protein